MKITQQCAEISVLRSSVKCCRIAFFFLWATAIALPAFVPLSNAFAASCPETPYHYGSGSSHPRNLGELKFELLNYKCFGAYDRDIARVVAKAQTYVERYAARVRKPALVLDIDETALSNWPEILANDFGYILGGQCTLRHDEPCGAEVWELSEQAEAIVPTLKLFKAARDRGVAVFFITGRAGSEQDRKATETNLHRVGYDGWTDLIMKEPDKHYKSIADFKAAERKKIEGRGFTIIANVGDQESDLRGGHARRSFKLPNPFYFLP